MTTCFAVDSVLTHRVPGDTNGNVTINFVAREGVLDADSNASARDSDAGRCSGRSSE